ncbi:hypothetical protein PFICI_01366 [Pestalotiopsis fici W106-1]|uniref:DNA mismatch repair protein MSH5 n=1 Tax=Pestalotiopsis fici (strain W106-1 / CGMCC3.15140) TaxID=1229662 RepID=W3XNA4_PESFW|nr:uncharacterized protein PFICI_01366 [Pestalotiopsis fici W106-1]ETS87538.1 hypothetical protein PFICI_01366 [Pestalotiopsis fici W106-1]
MYSRSTSGPSQIHRRFAGSSDRVIASSPPIPRRGPTSASSTSASRTQGYSVSSRTRTSKAASPSGSSSAPRSAIYSPQLPPHPLRQRLSQRPAPPRGASTTPGSSVVDGDDDADRVLEGDHLDADALGEIIMAIDMNKTGNLGCAYYIAAEEKLLLLEDVPMAGPEIVDTLLLNAEPTTILTPSRASETLLCILRKGAQGVERSDGGGANFGSYVLRSLTTSEFKYESAKEKLLGLYIESREEQGMIFASVVDEQADDQHDQHGSMLGSLMRLGTSINLESQLSIGCAGAVLSDLNRRRTAEYLPGDLDATIAFRIKSIEMFKLFDSMFVSADTLASLQILRSEFHPNSQMRGPDGSSSGAKESLSVYGLFHYLACTPQGKSKLRQIFLRPSIDLDFIKSRQLAISFLLRSDNSDLIKRLSKELRKIKNMRTTIAFLQKGVDLPGKKASMASNVWLTIQRFAHNALNIQSTLAEMQGSAMVEVVTKVLRTIQSRPLHHIGELITRVVDFEQSRERKRTAVKHGVDANLDELKRSYHGMEHFLTEVNIKLRADIPEWAQNYVQGCVFYPQLGFLTVVAVNPENGLPRYEGQNAQDIWKCIFTDDNVVYCKNPRMNEMDHHFGDAYCMIIDREIEILHQLSAQVLDHESAILAASDIIGELDSLLALAVGSRKYNWTAPMMTNENVLHIEGGRHPLQELVVPSFIANDCHMTGGSERLDEEVAQRESMVSQGVPSTLILTGPNHSGKSVYLKQVALIVYLAHIGCYVPAEKAIIGITDRILTRIATRESVSRNESAFAIDLRQAAFAINFASRRSLILVDEFGKGTNTVDGAGLMAALLHHFSALGSERPKLLAATHFHEIFEAGCLRESVELAFAHMEVHVDFDTPVEEDQVTYLFNLKAGRSVSSFGSRCAAMNGIDQAIVDRAEAIMLLLVRGEDLEAACSKLSEEEEYKLQKAEDIARAFLEQDIEVPSRKGKRREGHYRNILRGILAASEESSMLSFA